MSTPLSYCGLVCETCPIYIATREPDKDKQAQMRARLAEMCTKYYGMDCKPEDVNDCDGCRSGGRLFFGCAKCGVRSCAMAKHGNTCAQCDEYVCSELQAFFIKDPGARSRLEELRARLNAS
jgi:uncharacterized protein DUF3795